MAKRKRTRSTREKPLKPMDMISESIDYYLAALLNLGNDNVESPNIYIARNADVTLTLRTIDELKRALRGPDPLTVERNFLPYTSRSQIVREVLAYYIRTLEVQRKALERIEAPSSLSYREANIEAAKKLLEDFEKL